MYYHLLKLRFYSATHFGFDPSCHVKHHSDIKWIEKSCKVTLTLPYSTPPSACLATFAKLIYVSMDSMAAKHSPSDMDNGRSSFILCWRTSTSHWENLVALVVELLQ